MNTPCPTHFGRGYFRPFALALACFGVITCQGCYGPAVRDVNLSGGRFEDLGFGYLVTDEVYFRKESRIDDDSFARIYPTIVRLKVKALHFDDVPVTDATMQLISQNSHLAELFLNHTNVTLSGIESLRGTRNLRRIDLTGIDWTPDQISFFRKSMPSQEILYFPR